jgi:hypothetical protein
MSVGRKILIESVVLLQHHLQLVPQQPDRRQGVQGGPGEHCGRGRRARQKGQQQADHRQPRIVPLQIH